MLSTALLISVLAQKLELSRSEKYVHNFVVNMELAKERKNEAANVIKFFIRLWFLKRHNRLKSAEYVRTQRRVYRAIHLCQQLKQEQKRLVDACVGMPELLALQRVMITRAQEHNVTLTTMKTSIDQLEEKLARMDEKVTDIQTTLRHLVSRLS